MDLFSFHEEGPGFPFFHAKGMVIWNELMKFWKEEHTIPRSSPESTAVNLEASSGLVACSGRPAAFNPHLLCRCFSH